MIAISDKHGVRAAIQQLYSDTLATMGSLPKGHPARPVLSKRARNLKARIRAWKGA